MLTLQSKKSLHEIMASYLEQKGFFTIENCMRIDENTNANSWATSTKPMQINIIQDLMWFCLDGHDFMNYFFTPCYMKQNAMGKTWVKKHPFCLLFLFHQKMFSWNNLETPFMDLPRKRFVSSVCMDGFRWQTSLLYP